MAAPTAPREERDPTESHGAGALDGLHTLAVAMAAGVIAGILVLGFGGRFVMRILGATSGDAQGLRTDADQVVGEITNSGTIAVIVFVGIFGGVVAALAYVIARRWLPAAAGPAGVVVGVLLFGNPGGFRRPVARQQRLRNPSSDLAGDHARGRLALLFGVTFTALAARLDAGIPALAARPASIASHAALVIYLVPLLVLGAAVYVAGKAALRGRLTPWLESPRARRIGHVTVGLATIAAGVSTIRAISDIASA